MSQEDFIKQARMHSVRHVEGYIQAVQDFGIWKDGVQVIGCLETPIKDVIRKKIQEFGLEDQFPQWFVQ